MHRQQLLTRPNAPKVWAVVEETAPGGALVTGGPAGSAEHLATLTARSGTSRCSWFPNRSAATPSAACPLRSCASPSRTCRMSSTPSSSRVRYLDCCRDVDHYAASLDSLCALILTPDETAAALQQLIDEG